MVDFRPGVQDRTDKLVKELIETVRIGKDTKETVRAELAKLHPKEAIKFEKMWTELLVHTNGIRLLYKTPFEFSVVDKLEVLVLKQLAERAFLEKSL